MQINESQKIKIALVVSAPGTAKVFLIHQIQALSEIFDLTLVANLQGHPEPIDWLPDSVKVANMPIQREIHLLYDIKALLLLLSFFYKSRFSLVHSVTPKAGLLTMIATWIVRVPVRVHTFTGQVWVTNHGFKRTLLRRLDQLINFLATTVLVDSYSQRNFLIENRVIKNSGSFVLGEGSISGVDLDRFKIDAVARKKIRYDLGVAHSTIVLLFLGRIKREKGVLELVEAFSNVHREFHNSALWLVGPDEEQLQSKLGKVEGVRLIPFTKIPEQYMAAADIFCLPSYREGFGSVVIEAAACGIPSIGTNIYGLSDAISDGETGVLIPPRSVPALTAAIKLFFEDKNLRQDMGKAAHARAIIKFPQKRLTEHILVFYQEQLGNV